MRIDRLWAEWAVDPAGSTWHDQDARELGARVQELRLAAGVEQSELSTLVGLSGRGGTVSTWERGEVLCPLDRLVEVARVLQQPLGLFSVLLRDVVPPQLPPDTALMLKREFAGGVGLDGGVLERVQQLERAVLDLKKGFDVMSAAQQLEREARESRDQALDRRVRALQSTFRELKRQVE